MSADVMERMFVDARGRLHWPWRLSAFVMFLVAATMGASFIVYPVVAWFWRLAFDVPVVAYPWISLVGVAVAHALVRRAADVPMTWQRLGLDAAAATPRLLGTGLLIGTLGIGVPGLLLIAIGWLRVEATDTAEWLRVSLGALAVLLPAALSEELLLRGYPLAVLRERFGWQVAVGVTAVVFALLHASNPGADAQSLALVALAGLWLGVVRVVTGSLWAAFTAHAAWNVTMALVLHVPVSGLPMAAPGYRLVDAGPAWATGGSWGPEGGVLAALGMVVAMAALLARPAGRALIMRPLGRGETDQ